MSSCSISSTFSPRPAASRAMPAPLIPAPTMARSYRIGEVSVCSLLARSGAVTHLADRLELRHGDGQLGLGAGDGFFRRLVAHRFFGRFFSFQRLHFVQVFG